MRLFCATHDNQNSIMCACKSAPVGAMRFRSENVIVDTLDGVEPVDSEANGSFKESCTKYAEMCCCMKFELLLFF